MSQLRVADGRKPRARSIAVVALAAIVACTVAIAVASPVLAQTTPASTDSTRRDTSIVDSIRRDTVRIRDAHALQAALYAVVIAPAGLMSIIPPDSAPVSNPLGYWNDHVSLYASGGLASGRDGPILGASWTGTGSIELLRRGLIVEARLEQFQLLRQVEYRTLRAGRLWHSRARLAAGIMAGYRDVPGLRRQQGVEVAFPFIAGGSRTWMRWESSYVLSNRQSSWNYRLQWEHRPRGGPLIVGCNVELDSWELRNHGELSHGSFGMLVGTTFGR